MKCRHLFPAARAFTDAGGTRLYQGWAEGDSLNIGAMHQGGDTFLAIRQ